MSEHDEQTQLFQILALYSDKYPILRCIFAIPNGGKRHPATAAKMKAEGVLAGVWDIFVPVAVDDKCGLWIEMKVKSNKLTANQWAFRDNVGFAYAWQVSYSATAAARAIGEYLGIEELRYIT